MAPATVGLHQGSSLSPYIFDIIMKELGRGIIEPAPWDLLFADDIVILSTTMEGLQQKVERWRRALEDRGLKMSRKKTEYMVFNGGDESGDVCLLQEKLKKADTFKYLGSHIASDGPLDPAMNHRIQSGWKNWKDVSGVLCDRKISTRVKGKVYKTVVKPAMMYGAEKWPINKAQGQRLNMAEMRMLRWMYGITRMDKIRNERI